jgi:hypothetical protein
MSALGYSRARGFSPELTRDSEDTCLEMRNDGRRNAFHLSY